MTSVSKALKLDLSRTFIRRTDLSFASLVGANFTNADCSNAIFRGADFKNTILDGAILRGADLSGAKNLTREQIAKAIIDDRTILPDYLRSDVASNPKSTK
jgi:uncharacterized protein YjbI with pentapeptide repeats